MLALVCHSVYGVQPNVIASLSQSLLIMSEKSNKVKNKFGKIIKIGLIRKNKQLNFSKHTCNHFNLTMVALAPSAQYKAYILWSVPGRGLPHFLLTLDIILSKIRNLKPVMKIFQTISSRLK